MPAPMKHLIYLTLALFTFTIGCGQEETNAQEHVLTSFSDEQMDSADSSAERRLPVLSMRYTQALTDYIDTMFAVVKPDTLFIIAVPNDSGVLFPEEISGIKIAYWPGENAVQEAIQRRKTTISVNVVGWAEAFSSEFIIVTFFSNAQPQHNFHAYYSGLDSTQAFERDSVQIEYQYDNTVPLAEYLGK